MVRQAKAPGLGPLMGYAVDVGLLAIKVYIRVGRPR